MDAKQALDYVEKGGKLYEPMDGTSTHRMNSLKSPARPQPAPSREGATDPMRDEITVVRERSFSPSMELMHIILQLRRERITGALILDLSQGAVCSIRVRESSKVDPP